MTLKKLIPCLIAFPLALLAAPHESMSMEKVPEHMDEMKPMMESAAPHSAVAIIYPTAGNDTHGIVTFTKVEGGVQVEGQIENLTPGKHGFHVHQYGDLRKENGTSAGGHFNPLNKPHGGPHTNMRHVGDMGNVEANEDGVAKFSFVDEHLKLHGATSIIGAGLIVHAGEDDLESQPTGAAGPRVGMAVIGIANPEL